MSWDYRVIKFKKNEEICYTIAEVYYDEYGSPKGWMECSLIWTEYENLKGTITLLPEAFNKPILEVMGNSLLEIK